MRTSRNPPKHSGSVGAQDGSGTTSGADLMTEDDVVQLLTWLENVFPDRIRFGSQHISNTEAKLNLAKSFIEIRPQLSY